MYVPYCLFCFRRSGSPTGSTSWPNCLTWTSWRKPTTSCANSTCLPWRSLNGRTTSDPRRKNHCQKSGKRPQTGPPVVAGGGGASVARRPRGGGENFNSVVHLTNVGDGSVPPLRPRCHRRRVSRRSSTTTASPVGGRAVVDGREIRRRRATVPRRKSRAWGGRGRADSRAVARIFTQVG
jgi:hypothetical protein